MGKKNKGVDYYLSKKFNSEEKFNVESLSKAERTIIVRDIGAYLVYHHEAGNYVQEGGRIVQQLQAAGTIEHLQVLDKMLIVQFSTKPEAELALKQMKAENWKVEKEQGAMLAVNVIQHHDVKTLVEVAKKDLEYVRNALVWASSSYLHFWFVELFSNLTEEAFETLKTLKELLGNQWKNEQAHRLANVTGLVAAGNLQAIKYVADLEANLSCSATELIKAAISGKTDIVEFLQAHKAILTNGEQLLTSTDSSADAVILEVLPKFESSFNPVTIQVVYDCLASGREKVATFAASKMEKITFTGDSFLYDCSFLVAVVEKDPAIAAKAFTIFQKQMLQYPATVDTLEKMYAKSKDLLVAFLKVQPHILMASGLPYREKNLVLTALDNVQLGHVDMPLSSIERLFQNGAEAVIEKLVASKNSASIAQLDELIAKHDAETVMKALKLFKVQAPTISPTSFIKASRTEPLKALLLSISVKVDPKGLSALLASNEASEQEIVDLIEGFKLEVTSLTNNAIDTILHRGFKSLYKKISEMGTVVSKPCYLVHVTPQNEESALQVLKDFKVTAEMIIPEEVVRLMQRGCEKIVLYLLDLGVDPNAHLSTKEEEYSEWNGGYELDYTTITSVHLIHAAIEKDSAAVVRNIVRKGGKLNVGTFCSVDSRYNGTTYKFNHATALEYAKSLRRTSLIELLQQS